MKTLTLIFLFLATQLYTYGQTLTIEVAGLQKNKGTVNLGIYTSSENFSKKTDLGLKEDVREATMILKYKDLPAGIYAISVFQDENRNRKLDKRGLFNIPTERYGFSNNAKGHRGPPSFEQCSFLFSRDTTICINVNYYK